MYFVKPIFAGEAAMVQVDSYLQALCHAASLHDLGIPCCVRKGTARGDLICVGKDAGTLVDQELTRRAIESRKQGAA